MPGPSHWSGREGWCNSYVVDGDELSFKAMQCPKPQKPGEPITKHDAALAGPYNRTTHDAELAGRYNHFTFHCHRHMHQPVPCSLAKSQYST